MPTPDSAEKPCLSEAAEWSVVEGLADSDLGRPADSPSAQRSYQRFITFNRRHQLLWLLDLRIVGS
jgi:hypothetical protein